MEDTGAEVAPPGRLSAGGYRLLRGWCTAGKRLYKQGVSRSERRCAGPRDGGKGAWVRLCRPGGGCAGLEKGHSWS